MSFTYWNVIKPLNASEVDLQKHFEKFGLVDHISVAKDKNGGEGHKGFAFVTFVDKQVDSYDAIYTIPTFSHAKNRWTRMTIKLVRKWSKSKQNDHQSTGEVAGIQDQPIIGNTFACTVNSNDTDLISSWIPTI